MAATARSPHLLRITSGRGRPRLDSTAWVACALQILRARWIAVSTVGALALAPSWWLDLHPPAGDWGPALAVAIPWVAALLGESALLGSAALALDGRPSRPLKMIGHAIWRLPVMATAIFLRTAAVGGILGLGLLACDRAGDYGSLILVTAVILALAVSSAFSQATAVAFSERCGPIHALAVSVELTRDLRKTVLKAKFKLAALLILLGLLVGEIPWPELRLLGERALEVLWFAAGSLLTAVSHLVLRARAHRQRVESAAREIADAIA
ncbi:MAG: hypothetical protein R3A79_27160 [Nannocystaceae bacterium]